MYFSYDEKQYLSNDEKNRDISSQILEILTQEVFQLTAKIRTNREIASFIKPLFYLIVMRKLTIQIIQTLNYIIAPRKKEVISLSKFLQEKGWKVPRYTPGTRSTFKYEGYGIANEKSAHAVIGQEFDRVVAVIDETFRYDINGKLVASNSCYSQRQMLYQILTRTRQKVTIQR